MHDSAFIYEYTWGGWKLFCSSSIYTMSLARDLRPIGSHLNAKEKKLEYVKRAAYQFCSSGRPRRGGGCSWTGWTSCNEKSARIYTFFGSSSKWSADRHLLFVASCWYTVPMWIGCFQKPSRSPPPCCYRWSLGHSWSPPLLGSNCWLPGSCRNGTVICCLSWWSPGLCSYKRSQPSRKRAPEQYRAHAITPNMLAIFFKTP